MSQIREPELNNRETFPDICVCCGAPVPEGYMVCPKCERGNDEDVMEYFRPQRESGKEKKTSPKIRMILPF
ncbi:MAG: hypothetical protein LUI14_01035 [Lachnospiraceae bacterium]|nr:hypothetical protein [Lachnospiraceae bacterium]